MREKMNKAIMRSILVLVIVCNGANHGEFAVENLAPPHQLNRRDFLSKGAAALVGLAFFPTACVDIRKPGKKEKEMKDKIEGPLAEAFKKFQSDFRKAKTDEEVDHSVAILEQTVRQEIRNKGDISTLFFEAVNEFVRSREYLIERSPLETRDERYLVLYKDQATERVMIEEGEVMVRYVTQVTKFRDERLRGNPGWNANFTDDVIVFNDHISLLDRENQVALNGGLVLRPAPWATAELSRIAELHRQCLQKAWLGVNDPEERIKRMKNVVRDHEVEHKRLSRKFPVKEGDIIDQGFEETLVIVHDMRGKEPFAALAHLTGRIERSSSAKSAILRLASVPDTVEFEQWLRFFEAGRVRFALISGDDVARSLGFSSDFARLYDELVRRLMANGRVTADGRLTADEVISEAKRMVPESGPKTISAQLEKLMKLSSHELKQRAGEVYEGLYKKWEAGKEGQHEEGEIELLKFKKSLIVGGVLLPGVLSETEDARGNETPFLLQAI